VDQEIYDRLRRMSERLKREYAAQAVVLFGSYARGDFTRDSDVDLLVVARTGEGFFQRMASVRRLIRDLRDGLPVAPIVLTPEELEKRRSMGDDFITEILEKGVTL
jgi:predicted nucleotidyltransferase